MKNILLAFADSAFGIIKRAKVVDAGTLLPLREYVIDADNFDFVKSLNKELMSRAIAQ